MKSGQDNRLNGKNYIAWKARVTSCLRAKGLWDIVTRYELPPHSESGKQRFFRREAEAMEIMLESMSDDIVTSVENKQYAHEVFEHLRGVYEGRNTGSLVMSRREFMRLTYEDGKDMRQHLNKLTTLANQLRSHGRPVDDEEKALQLLDSLPASWESFKSVYYVQTSALGYEAVEQACMSEFRRRGSKSPPLPQPPAIPTVTEANMVEQQLRQILLDQLGSRREEEQAHMADGRGTNGNNRGHGGRPHPYARKPHAN